MFLVFIKVMLSLPLNIHHNQFTKKIAKYVWATKIIIIVSIAPWISQIVVLCVCYSNVVSIGFLIPYFRFCCQSTLKHLRRKQNSIIENNQSLLEQVYQRERHLIKCSI